MAGAGDLPKKPEMTLNAGSADGSVSRGGFSADPLTRIRDTYTLSNTKDSSGEVDELTVKNFLNTLAEVALAVAARKGNKLTDKDGNRCQ